MSLPVAAASMIAVRLDRDVLESEPRLSMASINPGADCSLLRSFSARRFSASKRAAIISSRDRLEALMPRSNPGALGSPCLSPMLRFEVCDTWRGMSSSRTSSMVLRGLLMVLLRLDVSESWRRSSAARLGAGASRPILPARLAVLRPEGGEAWRARPGEAWRDRPSVRLGICTSSLFLTAGFRSGASTFLGSASFTAVRASNASAWDLTEAS
mmetsp:Transcript_6902/g.15615  ORF Transcript_6902/g.15615 Transcript_6902/m.15615 type:complete len:213 (+) Transcript_6902:1411-2049(+)